VRPVVVVLATCVLLLLLLLSFFVIKIVGRFINNISHFPGNRLFVDSTRLILLLELKKIIRCKNKNKNNNNNTK
jgi:hypothetical protein